MQKTPSLVPVKPDRSTTELNPAINRINNHRTNRVNAWLNDKSSDAIVGIEPENRCTEIVQETKYRDCGVTKLPDSAPGNASRKTGASLPFQTYDRAKQTLCNVNNQDVNLLTYLDRRGRNEYITLAPQFAYDGSNIDFVFLGKPNSTTYGEDRVPFRKRKLELLRASCVGLQREMVNLFCASMKSMIRVAARFTSKPIVKAVHHGLKVSVNSVTEDV